MEDQSSYDTLYALYTKKKLTASERRAYDDLPVIHRLQNAPISTSLRETVALEFADEEYPVLLVLDASDTNGLKVPWEGEEATDDEAEVILESCALDITFMDPPLVAASKIKKRQQALLELKESKDALYAIDTLTKRTKPKVYNAAQNRMLEAAKKVSMADVPRIVAKTRPRLIRRNPSRVASVKITRGFYLSFV